MTAPRAPEQHRRPSPPDLPAVPLGAAILLHRPHPPPHGRRGSLRLPLARRGLVRLRPRAGRRGAARAHRRPGSPRDRRGADRHHPGQQQIGQSRVTSDDYIEQVPVRHGCASIHRRFERSDASDYTLTGVDIVSASSTGFTAQVCGTDASGLPTSTCTDLTPPDSFAEGTMSFTAPADTTLTQRGMKYAVVGGAWCRRNYATVFR